MDNTPGLNTKEITLSLGIEATPEKVYQAITTQEGLAGWYTPDAKAKPQADTQIELGFSGMILKFHVDKLDPAHRIVWSNVQTIPDWKDTRITFDIIPQVKEVNLTFSQTGFARDYADIGMFTYLWAQYMRSLKLLVETGVSPAQLLLEHRVFRSRVKANLSPTIKQHP
jgi:uncharacterized protein YndB with AHSA1/START domain